MQKYVGKYLDGLPLRDRWALTGKWVATELYSSARLPLRILRAVGTDAKDCVAQIKMNGLNPALFEYEPVPPPYEP